MKTLFSVIAIILCCISFSLAWSDEITLTWRDNSTNEDGYKIYRKLGKTGVFSEIGQVPMDTTTYVDTTPDSSVYCYEVRAFNEAGISFATNPDCGPQINGDPTKLTITTTTTTTTTTTITP